MSGSAGPVPSTPAPSAAMSDRFELARVTPRRTGALTLPTPHQPHLSSVERAPLRAEAVVAGPADPGSAALRVSPGLVVYRAFNRLCPFRKGRIVSASSVASETS
jgi:hypothetical protein